MTSLEGLYRCTALRFHLRPPFVIHSARLLPSSAAEKRAHTQRATFFLAARAAPRQDPDWPGPGSGGRAFRVRSAKGRWPVWW